MLLVWENVDPELPRLHEQGAVPRSPAEEFWPASSDASGSSDDSR
jgi:hypothetical protein